jgi:hypothetical protein
VDESVNIVLRNGVCDPFCTLNMNVLKVKVPKSISCLPNFRPSYNVLGGVHPADQIINSV